MSAWNKEIVPWPNSCYICMMISRWRDDLVFRWMVVLERGFSSRFQVLVFFDNNCKYPLFSMFTFQPDMLISISLINQSYQTILLMDGQMINH